MSLQETIDKDIGLKVSIQNAIGTAAVKAREISSRRYRMSLSEKIGHFITCLRRELWTMQGCGKIDESLRRDITSLVCKQENWEDIGKPVSKRYNVFDGRYVSPKTIDLLSKHCGLAYMTTESEKLDAEVKQEMRQLDLIINNMELATADVKIANDQGDSIINDLYQLANKE